MARLNWQRLHQQSRVQDYQEHRRIPSRYEMEADNRWSSPGRYYGKPLDKLPTNYLFWILDNFSDGTHRQRAEGEIYRRYYEISDTQGGRAGNDTAVENPG